MRDLPSPPPVLGATGTTGIWRDSIRDRTPGATARLGFVGKSTVDLAEYSADWPSLFEEAASALRGALGDRALVIEHIGSTAVPGLIAKPTIDIAVGVRSLDDVYECRQGLEQLGYDFRGAFHDHHLMIRKIVGDERVHHVHFRVYPAEEFDDWVLFRDLLRRDKSARKAYSDEKRALAKRFYTDRGSYVEAKTAIVEQLIAQARGAATRP